MADNTIHGRRNLVINGAMQVAQRGTSATSISTNTYVTCDRWQQIFSGAGAWNASQSTDAPAGFVNSQKYTCTTADTAIDAGDYFIIRQKIETKNLQNLKYGTSNAQQLTLSFWVKSSVIGTANITLHGDACSGGVDIICQNYTINTANTWEYKTLTFAGNTNADGNLTIGEVGISIWMWFKAGSSWAGGTATGNNWVTNASNKQAVGTNINISSSVGNIVAITGVQLELGSQATPFEHASSFGEQLALCQRYYSEYTCGEQEWIYFEGNNAAHKWWQIPVHATPRATPSVAFIGTFTGYASGGTISAVATSSIKIDRVSFRVTFSGGLGDAYSVRHTDTFTGDKISLTSEL